MEPDEMYPRELSIREFEWIRFLLPEHRPGYRVMLERVRKLFVLGEGRWGRYDFVLGEIGQEIDRTEGMRPVFAFGELTADASKITIAIHQPNDDGQIEFQISTADNSELPQKFAEQSRWTYSNWSPGEPCPATGSSLREIKIPNNQHKGLRLVIAPQLRVAWLHNPDDLTNTLIPVTNFYNELMLSKRIRDPKIVLDHRRLFAEKNEFTDHDLAEAFVHYNVLYRKVGLELFDEPQQEKPSFFSRLFKRGR